MRLIDADKIEFVLPRTLTEEEKKTYNLVIKKAFENAPAVDVVTWKDFRDFLDDNAEDFDCIDKRLKDIEERLLDAFEQITVTKMMERWESLARKVEMLERKLDTLMQVEDHEHEALEERLNAIEEKMDLKKEENK